MAFQQKEWKNRLSENPVRRLLTPVDGSASFQVDVTRAEGTILQQGDPFNAANMNDLEARIAAGIGGGDENMAPIEEGPESENAYTVGQLLIYDGQLYRVISAIAIGNSLVEGINIEATTISSEFVDELSANGNRIYMDYQNGKYGYNTSPTRGADTFHPFKASATITLIGAFNSNGTLDVKNVLPDDYTDLTVDNFVIKTPKMYATAWGKGNSGGGDNSSSCSTTQAFSYNPSTGILTLSGCYGYGEGYWAGSADSKCSCTLSGYVYAVI